MLGGTTGESATMSDDEQVALVALLVGELGDEGTIVAGAGSNDTRHAIELTERVVEAGAEAVLWVTPYYNKPNRRGIIRHFEEVARAAAGTPVILYNIPGRMRGQHARPTCSPSSRRSTGSRRSSRPTRPSCSRSTGSPCSPATTTSSPRTSTRAAPAASASPRTSSGTEMRRLFDEPDARAEIDASLRDVYATLFLTAEPDLHEGGSEPARARGRGCRLPMVDADEHELAEVKAMLERHGLLQRAATA